MDDLKTILIFMLVLVVLFWIMPDKKGKSVASNIKTMFGFLPISKVCDAFIAYFNNDRKQQ